MKNLYSRLMKGSPKTLGGSTQKMAKDVLKNSGRSKARAAEKCGVSKETFRRWLKGGQETSDREGLEQAQREARVKPRNAAKFAGGGKRSAQSGAGDSSGDGGDGGGGGDAGMSGGTGRLSVKATITISRDTRTRWLSIGGEVPNSRLSEVIQAMIESGPEAAESKVRDLIQTYYLGYGTPDGQIEIHDVRL